VIEAYVANWSHLSIQGSHYISSGVANIAVIPCFGLARQKLPYVQTLAGDGNWPIPEWQLRGRLIGMPPSPLRQSSWPQMTATVCP